MNATIFPTGMKLVDAATGGGVAAGQPWLIIDDRAYKFREQWLKGAPSWLRVVRDPTAQEATKELQESVLNDQHLVIVHYSSSPRLVASCSVVLRVSGGELIVVKNEIGTKARPRVRLPS